MFAVTTLQSAGQAGNGVFARRALAPGEAIFIETDNSRTQRQSWTPAELEALPEALQARVHHFGFELPPTDDGIVRLAVMVRARGAGRWGGRGNGGCHAFKVQLRKGAAPGRSRMRSRP